MTKGSWYIARQIAIAALFATTALCLAILLLQSLRLIDLIVNRGLPLSEFLFIAAMMLPRFVAFLLPLSVFAAAVFTYHRMTSDSELVIFRAAGQSPMQIARPAFVVAGAAAVIGYALSLYLVPVSLASFKAGVFEARNSLASTLIRDRQFTAVGGSVTVYFREELPTGELVDLLIHDARDPARQVTILAKSGVLVPTENGLRLVVQNGSQQSFFDETLHYLKFDRYTVDFGSENPVAANRWREPSERFLPDLLFPNMNDPNDAANHGKLIVEAHSRLASPLLPLSYTAFAVGIFFAGGFNRRGQPKVTLAASISAIGILITYLATVNLAGSHLALIPAIYLVVLLPLIVGIWLIARSGTLRRAKPERMVPAE